MANASFGFVQPLVVPRHRTTRIGRASSPLCSLRPNDNDSKSSTDRTENGHAFLPRFVRPARISAAVIAAAGAIFGATFAPLTPSSSLISRAVAASGSSSSTSSKQLRYDGRQELDSREKAMSLTLTAGTFAALGIWAWKKNRHDDELENVRIKDEVERLDKLRAEFMDVDEEGDPIDDEDLLASLKQRINEGTDADVDESADDEGVDEDADQSGDSDGDDILDNPKNAIDDPEIQFGDTVTDTLEETAPSSAESIDILQRMWDAADLEEKDNK